MKIETPDWCKEVKISDPEFKYIFTIDLKGRIVEDTLNREGITYKKYDKVNLNNPGIHLLRMQDSTINSYVDSYLLEHATPFRWIFSNRNALDILNEASIDFKAAIGCDECRNKEKCGKGYKNFYEEKRKRFILYTEGDSKEAFRIGGIEVKIFRSGAISILLRLKYRGALSIDECLDLIRYPEHIVIEPGKCYFGALNEWARRVCYRVVKKFTEDDYFKKARESIFAAYSSLKETNFNEVLEEIIDVTNPFNPHMYVGMFCSEIPVEEKENEQKTIIALANTTPEFANQFEDAHGYIENHNIARGDEKIILERRSWIVVSKRLKDQQVGKRYRIGLIETFLYSLETILSTTLAIERFNESLEEKIRGLSYQFNVGIEEFYTPKGRLARVKSGLLRIVYPSFPFIKEKFQNLQNFIQIISKARSISPCEDVTTSMGAHLKSATAIRAVTCLRKELALDELIKLARERMTNYSRFLMTGYTLIANESQKAQSLLLLILTSLIVVLTGALLLFDLLR